MVKLVKHWPTGEYRDRCYQCLYNVDDMSEPWLHCTRFGMIQQASLYMYNKCVKIGPDLLMVMYNPNNWLED